MKLEKQTFGDRVWAQRARLDALVDRIDSWLSLRLSTFGQGFAARRQARMARSIADRRTRELIIEMSAVRFAYRTGALHYASAQEQLLDRLVEGLANPDTIRGKKLFAYFWMAYPKTTFRPSTAADRMEPGEPAREEADVWR